MDEVVSCLLVQIMFSQASDSHTFYMFFLNKTLLYNHVRKLCLIGKRCLTTPIYTNYRSIP